MSRATERLEFDRVFRRDRRDAVLLYRPYPPHAGPRTHSWLGGLPALPAHHDWPRASDGTPLHFFAQVDCADIGFPTPLPERGVLFFFGRDDDEHEWNDGPASDACRVLYAPDATAATPRREAPADLPQVGGSYPRSVWPGFAHEGGRGPILRDEWPVRPLRIPSWPDALPDAPDSRLLSLRDLLRSREASTGSAWDRWRAGINMLLGGLDPDTKEDWRDVEARELRYKEELEGLRKDAFTEATGERPGPDPNAIMPEPGAGRAVFFHAEEGPEAYPQGWATVRHCALALLHRPASAVPGADSALQARLASEAEEWLRRANQAGLDEAVPEAERGAFRAWLAGMRRPNEETPLSLGAAELVFASTYATVRSWAGDPSRAALLPPAVYQAVRWAFDPFDSGSRVAFWQMLGHAPSPQRPRPPEDPTVCLLADPGGFCTFWIAPEDLARRDFSKAWGMTEGD